MEVELYVMYLCRSVPEEERQAKYVRVLTSSLLALKKLLKSLSESDREALSQQLAHIISQGKFWKYSKHNTPQVSCIRCKKKN